MRDDEVPPVAGEAVVELPEVELDLEASATGPVVCPPCLYLSWSLRSKDFPWRVPEAGSGSASQSSSEDEEDGGLEEGPDELVLGAAVEEAIAVGVVTFFVSEATATTYTQRIRTKTIL